MKKLFLLLLLLSAPVQAKEGQASYYYMPGKTMANGQVYRTGQMTAAHRTLKFGTKVKVTDVKTNKSVVVTITDRGPFIGRRIIDLSRAAAKKLGIISRGVARIRLTVL